MLTKSCAEKTINKVTEMPLF